MVYEVNDVRAILEFMFVRLGRNFVGQWVEFATETLYTALLKPGDSAIDVGAHRGRHTIPMARRVGAAGKVYAVEAASEMAEKLRSALQHAEPAHVRKMVTLFPFAVSNEKGVAQFTYLPSAAGLSGLRSAHLAANYQDARTETVDVNRLDDVIPSDDNKIRFIKLDIEGAELNALRGATGILKRCRPALAFENGGERYMERFNYTAEDFFGFFDQNDYVLYTPFGVPFTREWIGGVQPGQLFALPREFDSAAINLIAPAMIHATILTVPPSLAESVAAEEKRARLGAEEVLADAIEVLFDESP